MSKNELDIRFAWRNYPGKRVILHAPESGDAFIAKRVATLLPELEQVMDELIKILEPTKEQLGKPLHLYFVDAAFLIRDDATLSVQEKLHLSHIVQEIDEDAVFHVLQYDEAHELIIEALTQAAVKRWFGERATSSSFFLNGLAGSVAAMTGSGPAIGEVNTAILQELQQNRTVSIFVSPTSQEEATQGGIKKDSATSFVTYLLTIYGAKALRQFFTIYDIQRQDQAALTTYHRPLGQLEEAWLANLRKSTNQTSAILLFIQRVLPFLKPYRTKTASVVLYSILGLAFNVVLPLSTKFLLDTIMPHKDVSLLLLFSLMLLGFLIFNALVGIRRAQVTATVVQHVVADLQQESFSHLQRLTHQFYGRAKVGDLMMRLSSDVQLVQQALSQVIGGGLMMVLQTITSLIVLFTLQPLIGGLVIVIVPLVMLCYTALGKQFQRASADNQRLVGETATTTQENISAHAVIKAFGLEDTMITSYRARLLRQLKASVRLEVIAAFFQNSLLFASLVEQLIVLGVGGYMVIRGQITIGILMAAWSVLPSLLTPVSMLGMIIEIIQTASGSLERIIELHDEPIAIKDKPNALTLPPVQDAIVFEHVQFGYESDRVILDDLNVSIPVGLNVAIVGPSGSGKSSMISLLLRFWDPTSGRILWDGHDMCDITLQSLREQIGLVFQDTFIFDTTVRENIAISKKGATDSEIIAAAQGAKLDEYITSLPAGYNTMLGERGVRMSGGQRQRLAIARALLRNPRVLILDEATSALDAQTEREILETLDDLKRGRTTISVTHRLTVAATADHILVLDQGKLIEQGHHEALLQQRGLYYRLYQEQSGHGDLLHERTASVIPAIAITQLRAIPLFQNIDTLLLEKVARQMVRRRYAMSEYIVNQGETGDAFYILNFGQVEILLNTHNTKRRINILDEGDFFGEISLLVEEPRTASVRAIFPTECYVLTKTAFTVLLEQEPLIHDLIWQTMSQRRSEVTALQAFLRQTNSTQGPAC